MSHYIHHTPGRLRIKTPHVKRNLRRAEAVKNTLWPLRGIHSISISTLTGSVVVHYDLTSANSEEILQALKRACYFDETKAVTHDEVIHAAASNVGLFLSKTVCGAVLETTLEESALSMISALI
jgi:predicted DsbA family dithiol-disulfide isomerase